MAYSYQYLDGSLVSLPIYASQHAPYSKDNADTTFEEWPATSPSTADSNMVNEPYHRYTSDIAYLNASSHAHWHPGSPLSLPGLMPQFTIPPPDQWQGSTPSTMHHMAPEMDPGDFYRLSTPGPSSTSSSLPIRGSARAPKVYEEYEPSHEWEDPQDSLPRRVHRRRKSGAPVSSSRARARADPQRSSRPKTPRTMASRTGHTSTGSPAPSTASEERHFACEKGCPARFARKRDRDRHERSVHTGQTPYHCIGCQTGFVRSDARGRHWRIEPQCHKKHMLAELLEEPSPGSE